jgi:predicted aconitase|nr:aconitase X [Rhizobium rhizogenes]
MALEVGLVAELERFGVQFVTDRCWRMITDPVIPSTARTVTTNSGKYAPRIMVQASRSGAFISAVWPLA